MKTCTGCNAAIPKAHAYHGDAPYCQRCYYHDFKVVDCADCGCRTRTLHGEVPGLCRTCRVKGRVCMRCGKPVPRSHYRAPDGGVSCKACRPMVVDPTACTYCGNVARRVTRDVKAGFPEPACEQCRRAHFFTCPQCRKYRERAGRDSHGREVCAGCLAEPEFICPECKLPGMRHTKARCRKCYETAHARKLFAAALEHVTVPYVRVLFSELFEDLLPRQERPINFKHSLKVYLAFFQRIQRIAPTPMRLTAQALWLEFGRGGLRRNELAYNFLVKAGHVVPLSAEEADDIAEQILRRRLLDGVTVPWHRRALIGFEAALIKRRETFRKKGWHGDHERFQARTVTLDVRAAKRFLDSLPEDILALESLTEAHLDCFLMQKPGHRNALHAFVKYLNDSRKLFVKLYIDRRGPHPGPPMHSVMTPSHSMELVSKWLRPDDRSLKRSLILLFMLLYGQDATRATGLKWSQLVCGPDGNWQAKFAKVWIKLDPRVGQLLDRYAAKFRPGEKSLDSRREYVFPGRMPGCSLSPGSVTAYLAEEGVRAEQLFSTCLVNAYKNGVEYPKTLVRVMGVSMMTATYYFAQLDSTAAKTFARQHGRR